MEKEDYINRSLLACRLNAGISLFIRHAMVEQNLKSADLMRALNLSYMPLYKRITGKTTWRIEELRALNDQLGIKVDIYASEVA